MSAVFLRVMLNRLCASFNFYLTCESERIFTIFITNLDSVIFAL